ncbi:cellulose synthase/poly-beta-1,6-N-acetylglucosamine synthase-like glycosyltransferase [Fictibacillus halophilus]|uniref:4,4'-diaponeurosporenoate glycosyltransferase n=1 Tax=Fictibacillus halophilus TaxID=1610490 RepID=A0ABV2LN57_9BACL|nr:glycosyltransferase [Fictibacillus halophilus]
MVLICIAAALLFLAATIINSLFLPSLKKPSLGASHSERVAVFVPMRNEEKNVAGLVATLKGLTYRSISFTILDDHSDDDTYNSLLKHIDNDSRFSVLQGKELPSGWAGKVHACHQLSQSATGDYLLFIDADVRLHPHTIETSLALLKKRKASLLSGFPKFPVTLFFEKLIVPLQHFVILFHLPLLFANFTKWPPATAAHGAFMLFKSKDYHAIGGHASIKNSLVDDVDLAKAMKRARYEVVLANVTNYVSCYMYHTNKEVWNGFTKNLFPGLGRSIFLVVFLSIFYTGFYIAPLFFFIYSIFTEQLLWMLPYFITVIQKAYVDLLTGQKVYLALAMPLSAIGLVVLVNASMWKALKKQGFEWKGRSYQ